MLATSPLEIDNTITEDVEQIKYLGVYQHLAWKCILTSFCTQISKTIGMLYKARFHVPSKSLLLLYYSLVYLYLTCCNVVWSSS